MSTNSSNTQDNSNESVVEAFKDIISKLEEKGQDVDGILADLGGKNTLLQYLQDIEDDVVNDLTEVFKQAYAEGDLRCCIHAVISIATDDFYVYKRGIRKALYSEGNLLKNPLHYNFNQGNTAYIATKQTKYEKALSRKPSAYNKVQFYVHRAH